MTTNQTAMPELLPCPFCGSHKVGLCSEYDQDSMGKFVSIKCAECMGQGAQHFVSQGNECPQFYQEVRDSWNRRAAIQALSQQSERPYAYEYGKSNGDGTYSVVIERGDLVKVGHAKYEYGPPKNTVKDHLVKPLYAHPCASKPVLEDAKNTVLWLLRRLPKGYGEPPHVMRTIAALSAIPADATQEQDAQERVTDPIRLSARKLYFAANALLTACHYADKAEELPISIDGSLMDAVAQAMADCEDAERLVIDALTTAQPSDNPEGCCRSHPHENMSEECRRKTEEARHVNAEARKPEGKAEQAVRNEALEDAAKVCDQWPSGRFFADAIRSLQSTEQKV